MSDKIVREVPNSKTIEVPVEFLDFAFAWLYTEDTLLSVAEVRYCHGDAFAEVYKTFILSKLKEQSHLKSLLKE
jgi:hypothetical protein